MYELRIDNVLITLSDDLMAAVENYIDPRTRDSRSSEHGMNKHEAREQTI